MKKKINPKYMPTDSPQYKSWLKARLNQIRKNILQCRHKQEFCNKYPTDSSYLKYKKIRIDEYVNLPTKTEFLVLVKKDLVLKKAKKFKSKKELYKNNRSIYSFLQNHGLIEEVFKSMPVRIDKFSEEWYLNRCEEVRTLGKKFEFRFDYHLEHRAVYQWASKRDLLKTLCPHLKTKPQQANLEWARLSLDEKYNEAKRLAKLYSRRGHFQINHRSEYQHAIKKGYLDEICTHMMKKHSAIKWTKDKLRQVAKQCKTRGEFQTKFNSAYHCAYVNNLLDDICGHMPKPKTWVKKNLDIDKVVDLALSYPKISDFMRENTGAYGAIKRHNKYEALKKIHHDFYGDTSDR